MLRTFNKLRKEAAILSKNIRAIIFDACSRLFLSASEPGPSPPKVLIIKLDALGDFIIWTPAAQKLRAIYPADEYQLVLLCNHLCEEIALSLDIFDDVWSLQRSRFINNFKYRYQMLKKVRQADFLTVIQPTYSRELAFGDSLVKASGASKRIGFRGDTSIENPQWKTISNRWYTNLIKADSNPKHETDRNTKFLEKLTHKTFSPQLPAIKPWTDLPLSLQDKKYFVLFPGAGRGLRQWAPASFASLANQVHTATGWMTVLCGGPGEESIARQVNRHLSGPAQNWVGQSSISELITIIGRAQLTIANETSALHIAVATRTPSVCILGGGHFSRFVPYPKRLLKQAGVITKNVYYSMECFNCNWLCRYQLSKGSPAPCIRNISVANAWRITESVLNRIQK